MYGYFIHQSNSLDAEPLDGTLGVFVSEEQ